LKTENELLKMLTPLEAITEGLKAATPAEVEGWMAACEAVAGKMPALKASKPKLTKEEKEKKNTNPTGPAEFNAFIQAIWHEMAAVEGVVGEHDDAFKKASKEVGVTFQKARAEASRRKAEMEGKPAPVPKAPKAAAAAATAAPKAPKVAAPKPAAPKAAAAAPKPAAPKPAAAPKAAPAALTAPTDAQIAEATADYDDAMRSKMKAECEGYGWQACVFEEKACWLDPSTGDVFSYDSIATLGVYDAESGEFYASE
jgi:histone H1/5